MSENDTIPDSRLVDVKESIAPETAPDASEDASSNLPDNLQGKSVDEIVADYRKLQSERGRLGNEVGQLRKQVEAMQSKVVEAPQEPTDFWEEPEKAVQESIQPLKQEIEQLKVERLNAELRAHHPDFEQVTGSHEFQEWVKESRSRQLLATHAITQQDVDSARELLDTYKQALATGNATPQEADRRQRTARAASSERGSARKPTGKMYTHAELQNMRAYDRKRYEELSASGELQRIYKEGRVI